MLRCTDNHAELLKRVEAFAAEIHGGLSGVVAESCEEGAENARTVGKFKDQTGNLRRGIQGRGTGAGEGEIVAPADYASHVESGTKAHEIVATRAPLLRWVSDGAVHYAKRVWHPGTRGTPFMGPAYLKAEALLRAKAEVLTHRAAGRFGK